MGFKSRNWEALEETDLAVRITYCKSFMGLKDHRSELGAEVYEVPTVVAAVMDAKTGKVFVGVARCSPKDRYNAKLGREIAAGRALKLWKRFNKKTPSAMPQQKIVVEETGVKLRVIADHDADIALFIGLNTPQDEENQ